MNDRLVWRIAVRDSDLDAKAKHVALTLDTYMDRRGIAWPSRPALAGGTGYSVSTVYRALARLERAEFVVVAHSKGRRSNLYCASLPNHVTCDPVTGEPTGSNATPTGSESTPNRVTGDPRSRKNLSLEAVPADRSRDQDHINFNTDVDPAVLKLAYGWIADHRMR